MPMHTDCDVFKMLFVSVPTFSLCIELLQVWSAADCAQTAVLSGHTGAVNSISVSPGGEYVLTASDDQTVRVWSMKSGKTVRELLGHADKVSRSCVGRCTSS